MRISIGLELNNEGRALAWALDYPGCFAYGADGPEAVIALAPALVQYKDWVTGRAGPGWPPYNDFDLRLEETWEVYTVNDQFKEVDDGYAVNAWFRHDWKPLAAEEVERGLALLDLSRADLLRAAAGLSPEQMDRIYPGERWNIRGILKHVGGAEWWYLDRLGLPPLSREDLSKDAFDRLAQVRAITKSALPSLVGQELVLGKDAELWSPRKLLRRMLWHEIDHCAHIQRLIKTP